MTGGHSLPTFFTRTRTAKKIIVVDLGFLGDAVHLIPALWEIKRHYRQAALHVLTSAVGAEVLSLAPCVDRAWIFPLGPKSPPWWRHWNIIRELRREQFDLALNFSGADRTIFLTALTGAKWQAMRAGSRRHFWSRWLIQDQVPLENTERPVYEQRRSVLEALGFPPLQPARFDLRLPADAIARAEKSIPPGAIHLSINASTPLKEWPLARWIELGKQLLRENNSLSLVASGSRREREQARLREWAEGISDVRGRLLPVDATIADLAAALQRCRLHIGNDSGVLHLAAALGVPTFSIFRDYPGLKEWLPPGEKHRHVLAPCPCAARSDPPCLVSGEAVCLASISAETVAREVRVQLESI